MMIFDVETPPVNYQPVSFPDVQKYMDEPWFKNEAILIQSGRLYEEYGDSAYLIPAHRCLNDTVRVSFEIDVVKMEDATARDYAEEAWDLLADTLRPVAYVETDDDTAVVDLSVEN